MAAKPEIESTREDWIFHTSDTIMACRGQGHAWPKLKPGRVKTKYMRITTEHDGCYMLTQICRDCGTERELVTAPGGEIDFPAQYRYTQPDGYKTPKGSKITRRECLIELWRRTREDGAIND